MVCDMADRVSGGDCGYFGMYRDGCVCRLEDTRRAGDGRIAVRLLPQFSVAVPGAGAFIVEPGIFEDRSRDAERTAVLPVDCPDDVRAAANLAFVYLVRWFVSCSLCRDIRTDMAHGGIGCFWRTGEIDLA